MLQTGILFCAPRLTRPSKTKTQLSPYLAVYGARHAQFWILFTATPAKDAESTPGPRRQNRHMGLVQLGGTGRDEWPLPMQPTAGLPQRRYHLT